MASHTEMAGVFFPEGEGNIRVREVRRHTG
jgi:hypothetical protein